MRTLTVRGNHDRYLIDSPGDAMPSWESMPIRSCRPSSTGCAACRSAPSIATRSISATRRLNMTRPTGWRRFRRRARLPEAARRDRGAGRWHRFSADPLRPQPYPAHGPSGDNRLIVNPGSVGCPAYSDDTPYDHKVETGHPLAAIAIIETTAAGWVPSFRTVAYDHMAMSRLAAENARPDWAGALVDGEMR
jgi:hypothetical protein